MAEDDLRLARYQRLIWNTPLSEDHARMLLDRLDLAVATNILDLGCGWGELLMRAVEASEVTGTGVDSDASLLERARATAAERGLEGRVTFVCQPADTWEGRADRIMCIGASQAYGGWRGALSSLGRRLAPRRGRLLLGEGCWDGPTTMQATRMFGDVPRLPDLIEYLTDTGWHILHQSVADQREWDEFESSWRAGLQEWALAHPGDPAAASVQHQVDDRLAEYVNVYRGVLGFTYLILAR